MAPDLEPKPIPKAKRARPPYYVQHVQDAVRTLSMALHEIRQDPELLLHNPTLQERTEVQLEALAMAKALARGREYTPTITRPAMLAPWELRELALEAWHALVRLGFKGSINKAVKAWVLSLAVARASNPLPKRLPERSPVAQQWKRFQEQYRTLRQQAARGKISAMTPTGDLHAAHGVARRQIALLTFRPQILGKDSADGITLWKLRIFALERAIERRRR